MISESKISKFVGLLISKTKSKDIKWNVAKYRPESLEGEEAIIGTVYETEFQDKSLRLYKYSVPIQVDEFEFRTHVFFKLEFIDNSKKNLWTFPRYTRELFDLYETVQVKTSGIDDFIDSVIPDDDLGF